MAASSAASSAASWLLSKVENMNEGVSRTADMITPFPARGVFDLDET